MHTLIAINISSQACSGSPFFFALNWYCEMVTLRWTQIRAWPATIHRCRLSTVGITSCNPSLGLTRARDEGGTSMFMHHAGGILFIVRGGVCVACTGGIYASCRRGAMPMHHAQAGVYASCKEGLCLQGGVYSSCKEGLCLQGGVYASCKGGLCLQGGVYASCKEGLCLQGGVYISTRTRCVKRRAWS